MTRAVIAHRHRMVAEGLASILSRRTPISPVIPVTSESEAEHVAEPLDAVALDSGFPTALETASRLRRAGVRTVLLGDGADGDALTVPLDSSVTALARALVPGLRHPERGTAALSPREREILTLVAQGLVAKQVAQRLEISIKTVEHHKHRIYCKLGVPNQAAAIRSALVDGMV